MIELSYLAKYPFLRESKAYIKDNALSIIELLQDPLYERARIIGVERLDNAFKNSDVGKRSFATEIDCIMELLSYPIARMLTVCVDDLYFIRRYALAEAFHVYKYLINENTSFLVQVAQEFDFDIRYNENTSMLNLYFTNYLRNAPTRYREWKMVNRELENGYIQVSHRDLARIIEEALRNKIFVELNERQCDTTIYSAFSSDIKRLQNMVSLHKKKMETNPVGKVSIIKLPPCMKKILAAIQAGENVPHMGRFALVAFLYSLKLSRTDIIKLFSSAPDYEDDKTRYQIEHITGGTSSTTYTPPGCDKMRTYGLCPPDEIDDICKKKRHPLSYYQARWKEGK